MRNLVLIIAFILGATTVDAQRFGYVDSDYILENLPTYTQAQQRLKAQTEQWNLEIQNKQNALNKRQADFLNEKVLLTEDQIKKEEAEIETEIKAIRDLQEKRYGQNGDLINLRKSLVKPIQDQIWNAVKQVAEKRNYGFIFDKGSDLIMVYTDPKFDISREVLLILNPNANIKENNNSNNNSNTRNNTSNSRNNTSTSTNKNTNKSGSSRNATAPQGKVETKGRK